MKKYSTALLSGAFGLALAFAPTPRAQAQDKVGTKMTGETVTATGCLTKDAKEKNEYLITDTDGKTWGLKSNTVKLNDHLNHKVTIVGKVTKGGHGTEADDMNVTNLTMVSETCN